MASLLKELNRVIDDKLKSVKNPIDIYEVTGINTSTYKVNIKSLTDTLQFDDVSVGSFGLGNLKGFLLMPEVGDLVAVAFIREQPFIISSFFDQFTQNHDNVPGIEPGELLITPKQAGAIIFISKNGQITISRGSSKSTIKIKENDDIEINHSSGSKITLDTAGNVNISGTIVQITTGTNKFIREGDNVTVGAETGALTLNSAGAKMRGGD